MSDTGLSGINPVTMNDPVTVITQVANQYGLPPEIALATAYHESGLNPQAVGDNGTSFGLFQLHEGGELGSLSPQQAFDPITNAETAIPVIASVYKMHPNWTPGQIAAAAQRPANQSAYAQAVNQIYQSQGWKNATATLDLSLGSIANGVLNPLGSIGSWLLGKIPGFDSLSGTVKLAEIIGAAITSKSFWIRLGEGALGAALLIVGLVLLFKNDLSPIFDAAAKVAPLAAA